MRDSGPTGPRYPPSLNLAPGAAPGASHVLPSDGLGSDPQAKLLKTLESVKGDRARLPVSLAGDLKSPRIGRASGGLPARFAPAQPPVTLMWRDRAGR